MAYATVQTANAINNGTSPITASLASKPSIGNLILCTVHSSLTTAPSSVVDGNSASFTLLNNASEGSQFSLYLYGFIEATNNIAARNVTVTSAGATLYVTVYEFSGNTNKVSLIIDSNAGTNEATGANSTTNAINSSGSQPSVNTTNPYNLIFSQMGLTDTSGSGGLVTTPNTFTILQQNPTGGSGLSLMSDAYYQQIPMLAPTGTYNPSWSWTNSRKWVQLLTALLPAFAVLQRGSSNGSGANVTFSFANNTTAGNAILVIAFSTFNALLISDSKSNVYISIASNYNSGDGFGFQAWMAYNIVGGADTVTVATTSHPTNLHVYEISGIPNSNDLDVSTFQYQSAATSLSSGSVTTTQANDLLIGASCENGTSGSWTIGANYFNLQTNNGATLHSVSEEMFTTTTGSNSATFSLSTNTNNTVTLILALSTNPIGLSYLASLGVG